MNCSDLERSLEFYRDHVGLRLTVRTRPERPQPGSAFGLKEVQWDAWMLAGDDVGEGPVLDLLEWIVPVGVGSPPESVFELGLGRLCITSEDLAGLHQRLTENGHDVWSPPVKTTGEAKDLAGREYFRALIPTAHLCSSFKGTAPAWRPST